MFNEFSQNARIMDVFSYTISKVFSDGGKIHYVLPHFQREYRWGHKNWEVLLEDTWQIYDALDEKNSITPEHFLGALVVLPDGNIGLNVPVHRLVDGQQRLTTLSLLLCAFGQLIEQDEPELFSEIQSYLFNLNQKGDGRFKLLPTLKNGDRAAYQAVLDCKPIPDNQSRIPIAHEYFYKSLKDRRAKNELDAARLFRVLTQTMQVVCISLNANENAYQIFESLNNKAEPLKQSDLVRNYIAMRLSSDKQERAFHEHWAPIENLLDDNRLVGRSSLGELTALLRHFDSMRTGVLPPEKHIYARFRDDMKQVPNEDGLISELATLRRFASYYDLLLRPDKSTLPALRNALLRLEALDVTTAYPLLLAIADRFDRGEITLDEYTSACAAIENYLVRRFLVDAPTHFLNKMFAALPRAIDWNDFVPSLRANLALQKYPSDARIRQVFPGRSLYDKNNTRAKLVMLFETINRHLYAGTDVVPILGGAATIEHILPQALSAWWQNELGEDAEAIAGEWKHSVGNLTLVTQSYNSSLSNDSFPEKKNKLLAHGLKLNSEYFAQPIEKWDADEIQQRAAWLTNLILEIWPSFSPASESAEWSNAGTPVTLHIDDNAIAVASWRDVMRETGKFIKMRGTDFSILNILWPNIVKNSPFKYSHFDLENGYFLNTDYSGKDTLKNCERLLQAADLGDVEWRVETR